MFKNYLRMALRNITGNRLYSAINIVGLGIGLACCLLIMLFVRFELSYEQGFTDADRIYRISRDYYASEGARERVPATVNAPVAPALVQDFPQIEAAGRLFFGDVLLSTEELSITEPAVRVADSSILKIFDFEWLTGDATTALDEPNTMVLTESLARRYFNSTDIVGERIRVFNLVDVNITGVIRDLPTNTHLSVSGMISLGTVTTIRGKEFLDQWNRSTDFHTYLKLREGANIDPVRSQLPAFMERHGGEQAAAMSGFQVMNIQNIHLRSNRDEEWKPPGSLSAVYSFAAIAFCILLIACINFMSISTARSSKRAKEVGMRKTLGASRPQLVMQFLGEAALTAIVAMLVAIALAELMLPSFSSFSGIAFDLSFAQDRSLLALTFGLILFVAAFAGSYPAIFLSNFNTAKVLKGELTRGRQGLAFRNTLVVVQFSIAIALVIATVVIHQQRTLATTLDMGFNKDQVVVLTTAATTGYKLDWPVLKQQLLQHPAIENVTASHYLPFGFNDNQIPVSRAGFSVSTRIQYILVDFDFFETYDIEAIEGRVFRNEFGADANVYSQDPDEVAVRFILNVSAARALGMSPAESINSRLDVTGLEGDVVGVIEDTYFESIHFNVRPLLFILAPPPVEQPLNGFRSASIKVRADAIPAALAHIDATWQSLYPQQAVNRHFLDEDFQGMYLGEARQNQLFTWFSTLAILIACFGLFGLASYNAERRTKEIGVRKVMGGSVWSIVLLLTNDFSRLVLISNVIAWPIAYVVMNRWLENFAYRIDLAPLVFIGSGLIALCIAWVTIGGTAAKAANTKPVLALRYE